MKFKAYLITKEGLEFSKIFTNVNKYTTFVQFFQMKVKNVIECK